MSIELPARSQRQSQSQDQVITVNLNSSSDPELERRIFTHVYSAGRQPGQLAAVGIPRNLVSDHGGELGREYGRVRL